MPRQKVLKPTNIYWLYDVRPEKISLYGPKGEPFYCGKTIDRVERRLRDHQLSAPKRPCGKISSRLIECSKHVRVETVEIVPPNKQWDVRERHWIAVLRKNNPNCVNVSDGGTGFPGTVHSAEARAKIAEARKDFKHSDKVKKQMSIARSAYWEKRGTTSCILDAEFDL